MPTRLLHVWRARSGGFGVRLCQPKDIAPFVALSYCWGRRAIPEDNISECILISFFYLVVNTSTEYPRCFEGDSEGWHQLSLGRLSLYRPGQR